MCVFDEAAVSRLRSIPQNKKAGSAPFLPIVLREFIRRTTDLSR
jgi:hypothetical protein